jgi:hypothetical protein
MKRIAPFINTAMIFIAGYDALDDGISFGYVYLACGLIYLVPAVLTVTKRIREKSWMEWAGAFMVALAAFDYFLQGKKAVPIAYLGTAVLTLFLPWARKKRAQKLETRAVDT